MDIIYRKSDGKIYSIFSTHGGKHNIPPGFGCVALNLPVGVEARDLERLYYLNPSTKKFVKKEVLEVSFDGKKIKIIKKTQDGKIVKSGKEKVELEILHPFTIGKEGRMAPMEDRIIEKREVELVSGELEIDIGEAHREKKDKEIEQIAVSHPLFICRCLVKQDWGVKKFIKGRWRRVPKGIKTWRLLP